MSKQIYIDSNGNEVLVSGTVETAGNLPLGSDFTDPTSTAYAINSKANISDTFKIEMGSGSGSGTVFTFPSGSSTNGAWLVFFGGSYVGIVTIFSTTTAITKIAGSTALTATATLNDGTVTITLTGAPWTQLRYAKLFA